MQKTWLNCETDRDMGVFSEESWSQSQNELLSGEFWADRIKTLKNVPDKRLALALDNLPLPAAFREAAIAIRALVREKKSISGTGINDDLQLLYWLAAVNSFTLPYSRELGEPGHNVTESIPGAIFKTLPFSYNHLGYEKLSLLNKTDIKWLIEQWGEPSAHTTLNEMHNNLWREYELKLKKKRKAQEHEWIQTIEEPLKKKGHSILNNKLLWLFLAICLILILSASD